MANLKPLHAAAIARLASYTPPPTSYFSLPLSRRASVLVLLYADRKGELRVVLTMRANTLSSYAGQAALPGGKADTLQETPIQTARREAFEEIGLPLVDTAFPPPFRIQHLCQLPAHLARTELGVRPCIAWIEADPALMKQPTTTTTTTSNSKTKEGKGATRNISTWPQIPSVEDSLIPRLNPKEVAAVFTAPFESFLSLTTQSSDPFSPSSVSGEMDSPLGDSTAWYTGQWIEWHTSMWRMHNFYVPSHDQPVAWASPPPTTMTMNRFRVFGMTARILVDAARVAFGREPEFEHNSHFGDEEMIRELVKQGKLRDKPATKRRPVVGDEEGGGARRERDSEAKM